MALAVLVLLSMLNILTKDNNGVVVLIFGAWMVEFWGFRVVVF
jgi:hypothetical protein